MPNLQTGDDGDEPSTPAHDRGYDDPQPLAGDATIVWKNGEMVDETSDITHLWRNDFVSFALGCSFSFEDALHAAGIPVRHQDAGRNVPMYLTSLQTQPAGRFSGPVVVSMRPMPVPDAIEAIKICDRFPLTHGAPVHLGNPADIGIADIMQPDYADVPDIWAGDIPVF